MTPQKNLRLNCSHMLLYPPSAKKHLDLIAKENLIDSSLFNKLGLMNSYLQTKKRKVLLKILNVDVYCI